MVVEGGDKRMKSQMNTHEWRNRGLFDDLGNDTSSNGLATLADGEAETLLNGHLGDHFDGDHGVLTGEDHLLAVLEVEGGSDVAGAEVKLGAVVADKGGVTSTLLFLQNVELGRELLVDRNCARGADDHAAADVLPLHTTEQGAEVITSLTPVKLLLEHLNASNGGLGVLAVAEDLDLLTLEDDTSLNTTGDDGATARNGEDIFNRHEERFVKITLGDREVAVDGGEELDNRLLAEGGVLVLKRLEGGAANDGHLVSGEAKVGEQVPHLHLHEVEHLLVVNGVNLVHKHNQVLHTNLFGQEQVLAGLGHLTVGGADHNNGTVHLGGTGDHVLDVICVSWTNVGKKRNNRKERKSMETPLITCS